MLGEEDAALLHDMRKAQDLEVRVVSSESIASGSIYTADLHIDAQKAGEARAIEFDLEYDPEVLTPGVRQIYKNGVQMKPDVYSGKIHVSMTTDGSLPVGNIINYATTRIGKIQFDVAETAEDLSSKLSITNLKLYSDTAKTSLIENLDAKGDTIDFTVKANKKYDLNADGVVGAGDVALADADQKAAVASEAGIYPYKRVVSVTMDGGGLAWSPDKAWYLSDWGEGLDNVRTNTYAMDLHNQEFATSYSAQSVNPPISAQNYISMLSGQNWAELPVQYKYDNDKSDQNYWAEFGDPTNTYPSVFKVIQQQDPTRALSMFTEWKTIEEGIINPDAGAVSINTEGGIVFDKVADFIRENPDLFKKTALTYMQSDVMDEHGHAHGYFTDGYYKELKNYDEWWKNLIDALKETGLYEDTLIISNADHGGSTHGSGSGTWGTHGDYSADTERMVYFSAGGQTINKGAKLEGGCTNDLAGLVLEALRLEKPENMADSGQFDDNMFLNQEQLAETDRDIEEVQFIKDENNAAHARIQLDNVKNTISVIDAVVNIEGTEVPEVSTKGTVLRNEIRDGKLYLTISFEEGVTPVADLTFKADMTETTKIEEVMLANPEGKEIYPNLVISTAVLEEEEEVDTTALAALVSDAEAISLETLTPATRQALEEAINNAKAILEKEHPTKDEVNQAAAALQKAMETRRVAGNKMLLNLAITEAEQLKADGALEGVNALVVRNFETALANAKTVSADEEAVQDEINDAWSALVRAIQMLDFTTDFTELDEVITKAETIDQNRLKEGEAKTEFIAALKNAREVRNSETALTDQSIAQAVARLNAAMEALEYVVDVDTTILEVLVSSVEDTDLSLYLEAGQTEFTEALASAKAVLENPESQAQVNDAPTALNSAWMNLRMKPDEKLIEQLKDFVQTMSVMDLSFCSAPLKAEVRAHVALVQQKLDDGNLSKQEAEDLVAKAETITRKVEEEKKQNPVSDPDENNQVKPDAPVDVDKTEPADKQEEKTEAKTETKTEAEIKAADKSVKKSVKTAFGTGAGLMTTLMAGAGAALTALLRKKKNR